MNPSTRVRVLLQHVIHSEPAKGTMMTQVSTAALADEYGKMDSKGEVMILERFELESKDVLQKAECCYKTWGRLNQTCSNVLVICHALTGNADVEAWWGALLGPGKAFDTNKYFVFASNMLGSCYGTCGPCTINPSTGKRYGGSFPRVTIRDMAKFQCQILKSLGVKEIFAVIGGSMGGMVALEFVSERRDPPAKALISLSSTGRHSPWQIGISECQRQAIFADPNWQGGQYSLDRPPSNGLSVARMMAMVSYRTHPRYMTRFGRERGKENGYHENETLFQVEQYLQAQGKKFNERGFDAASYVSLTYSMDTHDVTRPNEDYFSVLENITVPSIIVSISSDVLYPPSEQLELAQHMPNAQHHMIESPEGHDGFLLEHTKMSVLIRGFLAEFECGIQPLRDRPGAEIPQPEKEPSNNPILSPRESDTPRNVMLPAAVAARSS
eukprot:gnl/MRDRNA2_/MRDRNA2_77460_c0_seq1.p1 gnl/MRDRNA2_/MRDRNA2_77460_c0~~gnl/MRDRNA2_/MRDRNA2_77460_c0_seq1.p1  ORF type:complete len:441 (+),score=80.04 gnl/MRDRNA2_/MRDRNA2_77460_c0_seq1:88-1410(+)